MGKSFRIIATIAVVGIWGILWALNGSKQLPACGDVQVKNLINEAADKAAKEMENPKEFIFIDITNVKELGFNKEKDIRKCQADFIFKGEEVKGEEYLIIWKDKKNGMFGIESL